MTIQETFTPDELNQTTNQQILERLKERMNNGKETRQQDLKRRFLIFRLANDWFGVEAPFVREISRLGAITRVPLTRSYVAGVVNLRGNITAVIDIRSLLGLPTRVMENSARIVVLTAEGLEAGVLADAVAEVVEVQERYIEPALLTLEREQAAYTQGSFELGDRNISVLNPSTLLLNLKI
jgi:purine-binding chemotaxis protein CheW